MTIKNLRGLMAVAVVALVGLSGCASYPTAPLAMSHAVNDANPGGVYGEVVGGLTEEELMESCLKTTRSTEAALRDAGFSIDLVSDGCAVNVPGHNWTVVMMSKSATKGDYVVSFRTPVSLHVKKGDVVRFYMPTSRTTWLGAFREVVRRAEDRDDTCPGFTGPPLHEQVKCNGWEAFRDFLPIIKRDEFWSKKDADFGLQPMEESELRGLEETILKQTGKRTKCVVGECKLIQ